MHKIKYIWVNNDLNNIKIILIEKYNYMIKQYLNIFNIELFDIK